MDRSARISIIDDDSLVRDALCRLCTSAGYQVEAFGSAEAFVETVSAEQTDCLILDVHLPGRSGLELQSDLLAANLRFPIVFVTAFEDKQAKMQGLKRGAVEFLLKPLDSKKLLDAIDRTLHK